MDVIDRRMLMGRVLASMAGSQNIIKGSITVDDSGTEIISFGKTINDYIFYIEMTDDSYSKLVNAIPTLTGYKGVSFLGKRITRNEVGVNSLAQRIVYNNGIAANTSTSGSVTLNDSEVRMSKGNITDNSPGKLYIGYSYNYMIIPYAE